MGRRYKREIAIGTVGRKGKGLFVKKTKHKKANPCTECGIKTRQVDGICVCCKLNFPYEEVLWLEDWIAEQKEGQV